MLDLTVLFDGAPVLQRRKLPADLTVGRLKALLAQRSGVDANDQCLFRVIRGTSARVELDDDLRALSDYAIEDGDTIVLEWRSS